MDKICQFCNKEFSTLSNLRAHLKTSKSCINSRPTINKDQLINIRCEFCSKEFSKKGNLTTHFKTCKVKKTIATNNSSEELNNIKEELRKLKNDYNIVKIENENIKREYNDIKENASEMNFEIRLKDEQLKVKDEQLKVKDEQLKRQDELINVLQHIKINNKKTNNESDSSSQITNNNTTNNNTINNNTTNIYLEFANMTSINSEELSEKLNNAVFKTIEFDGCIATEIANVCIQENAVLISSDHKNRLQVFTVSDISENTRRINYGNVNKAMLTNINPLNTELLPNAEKKYNNFLNEQKLNPERYCTQDNMNKQRLNSANIGLLQHLNSKSEVINPNLNKHINDMMNEPLLTNGKKKKINTNTLKSEGLEFKVPLI